MLPRLRRNGHRNGALHIPALAANGTSQPVDHDLDEARRMSKDRSSASALIRTAARAGTGSSWSRSRSPVC